MARFRPGEDRKCPDCGVTFSAQQEWMVRCINCYFIHRDGGATKARTSRFDAPPSPPPPRVEYRDRLVPDKDGEWLRTNLKALLVLCHPDKHGGTDLAHDITIYLTQRYKEVKR